MAKDTSTFARLRAGLAAVALTAGLVAGGPARAAEETAIPAQDWSFDGLFGTYDRGALQRGFKVYSQVCAACHGMRLVYYRNLGEPGGPGFSEAEVKAIAAAVEVEDGPDKEGEMFMRPGLPRDTFVSPFANDNAARAANNGALPPDLSVIAKARPGGPDYLYALLTGYEEEPPEGVTLRAGMSYNKVFPGNQIAMPLPLFDDMIEYDDGTPATAENMARDLTTFLMWAAEPKLEARKRMGFQVIVFLIVLAGLFYFTNKKIWSRIEH